MRRQIVTFLRSLGLSLGLGLVLLTTVATTLTGCGFQLRGQAALPFSAAFVTAAPNSNVGNALRRALNSQQKLAATADAAPVRITLDREAYSKSILALSGGGKVREYRLEYRVWLSVADGVGKTVVEPTEIHLSNDFSYSDAQALAKEAEEASLKRAMEQDALRQIMRRLSYLKL